MIMFFHFKSTQRSCAEEKEKKKTETKTKIDTSHQSFRLQNLQRKLFKKKEIKKSL